MTEVLSKYKNKYQAIIEAKRLESFTNDRNFLPVYASSTAKIYPYQIASARFAIRSEYLKGCILCDEGSLGKTYEALLVAGQMWYEGKENILVVLPSNLIKQWLRKIDTDFTLPHVFWNNTPSIPDVEGIVITTYDFAVKYADRIKERDWDLVIFDEADILAKPEKQLTTTLKSAVREAYKLLLTPTPITLSIMDIYGLIHFIDETVLPNADWFYKRYFRKPENYSELTSWVSQYCFRTLKAQATDYVSFSRRIPFTVDYPLIKEEKELYNLIKTYLASDDKIAYPEIDEYNLNLRFFNTLSSSPQALVNMLKAPIERTYGLEKAVLLDIQKKASQIEVNSKTIQLLKILKTAFNHLKASKVNQKAIVFATNSITLDVLYKIFSREGYNTLKYKDNETLEKFRADDEIQILVTTDSASKGLDIEYCPIVVNYDLLYNSIEMEQRICRCHRQGQKSDVLVINMLSKENFADVRILELINKRTLQFNGIFGMSDDIVGNFDSKISEVLKEFRHVEDVSESFKDNLEMHKIQNENLVSNTEDVLFTTFSKSIADKVTVTPQYIEEKTAELNQDLWELVKYYFTEIKPDWYVIDDNAQTLTLTEGYRRPYLFVYHNDMNRRKSYEGYQQYGMAKDYRPTRGRITLTSLIAKGILKEFESISSSEAKICVAEDIEPCEIGFYDITITRNGGNHYHKNILVGQTLTGKILSEDECRKLLSLSVTSIEERDSLERMKFGDLLEDIEGLNDIDNLVSEEEILADYFKNKEGSIAYEEEKLQLLAGRKKSQLEVGLNDLRTEIKELKKDLDGKVSDRLEELKITKQLRLLEKDLMKKEEGLFFDKAQVDVETEQQIRELREASNFKVFKVRRFRLRLLSKDANPSSLCYD